MLNPTLPLSRNVCALCSVQAAAKPTAYFSSKHCLQQQKRSSKPKKADSSAPITVKEGTNKLPIAYVNVDSLLLNYNYSKDLNELILKKYENTRASLNQKANSLQSDAIDFQKKVEA